MSTQTTPDNPRTLVEAVYRAESRRVLATLIRLLGDFDLAEEALHDAFASALEQWPRTGLPPNPRAWLVSTGRFKGIDALRRRAELSVGAFDYGPVHFVVVDNYTTFTSGSAQYNWLVNDLAATAKPWKIILQHEHEPTNASDLPATLPDMGLPTSHDRTFPFLSQ